MRVLTSGTEHRGYVIAALSGELGLAVLVGSGRRARLLGGFLRLAAPSMAVAGVLAATGMDQHLDIFPTVKAAIAGRRVLTGMRR